MNHSYVTIQRWITVEADKYQCNQWIDMVHTIWIIQNEWSKWLFWQLQGAQKNPYDHDHRLTETSFYKPLKQLGLIHQTYFFSCAQFFKYMSWRTSLRIIYTIIYTVYVRFKYRWNWSLSEDLHILKHMCISLYANLAFMTAIPTCKIWNFQHSPC